MTGLGATAEPGPGVSFVPGAVDGPGHRTSNSVDGSTEFSTSPANLNFTPTAAEAGKTRVTIEPDSGNLCAPASTATLTLTYTAG